MTSHIDNNIISRFLIDRQFRLYRHLLLMLIVLIISTDELFDIVPDKLDLSKGWGYRWLIYFMFINLIVYVNVYILAPYLLIKDKLFQYLVSVLFLVLIAMGLMVLLQTYLDDGSSVSQQPSNVALILNLSASLFATGFLVIGTSALLLFKHWVANNRRIDNLESATLESELKFLKSQINPHFLFNMLNNANIMVGEDPQVASQILVKLDDLLRYQMNDSTRDKVYLNADILFLTDFLDLEKTRRDDFDYTISKQGDVNNVEVPPLLFIPFVENAVKHNSDSENRSYITVSFRVLSDKLVFTCENSKPNKKAFKAKSGGLGLANIKRRLDLLYGENYLLEKEETQTKYKVRLTLTLTLKR